MKIIFVSDIHIGWKLYNLPELAQDLRDLFTQVADICIKELVDFLVIVGDLFDTPKPTSDDVGFIKSQIERLNKNNVKVIGIAGDHEYYVDSQYMSWLDVSGVKNPNDYPNFLGFNYIPNPAEVINKILNHANKNDVEWILAHAQDPSLFKFSNDRKRLDFSNLDLEQFPKLKGIILGDIHLPLERTEKDIFIGYCGSLGYVKSDEIDTKKGILFYNGEKLIRHPIVYDRDFIVLRVPDSSNLDVKYYYNKYKDNKGKKPLIILEYANDTDLNEFLILDQVAICKRKKFISCAHQQSSITIRSEISNYEKIATLLKDMCSDGEVADVLQSMLLVESGYEAILDKFKNKATN